MAGRGTDIVLGGNLKAELAQIDPADAAARSAAQAEWQKRHEQVVAAGGLHIIGTERHESRRIDNQLRGRSGRQGDPGSSRFYLSLEDNLMRIFGDPDRTKRWLHDRRHEGRRGDREQDALAPDRARAAQGRGPQLRPAQEPARVRRRRQRPAQGHLPAAHRADGGGGHLRFRHRHPRRGGQRASSTRSCRARASRRSGTSPGLAEAIEREFQVEVDPKALARGGPRHRRGRAARARRRGRRGAPTSRRSSRSARR